jgi:hypothetical protein
VSRVGGDAVVRRLALLVVLNGCADPDCPRGSMVASPGGLVVTPSEHPTGWGGAACEECHAFDALHLAGCTPEVDLVEAQERVASDGVDSCAPCHGDNGVAR